MDLHNANRMKESDDNSEKIPEFFLKNKKNTDSSKPTRKIIASDSKLAKKEGGGLVDADYNRKKLFSKGINLMADEKLEDASHIFSMILRIDPNDVNALLKLGYALSLIHISEPTRLGMEDYTESMKAYDKVLDIDVTNADAWNLKSLIFYERKIYGKALDCADKAIDSDPTFGMAWYNRALSLIHI